MAQETGRDTPDTPDLVDVAEETTQARERAQARTSARAGKRDGRARARPRSRVLRSLPSVVVILLLVVLVPSFIARVYAIPSGSMETTLHGCTGCTNDRVLVDKVSYHFTTPKPGDVIVFIRPDSWHNSELEQTPLPTSAVGKAALSVSRFIGLEGAGQTDLIKRVIAVGGQTVSCCDSRGRVLVDGKPLDEPYVYFAPGFGPAQQAPFGPVTVPPGNVWAMGDSRNNSVDSRAPGDGPVPLANVVGRARLIVYPLDRVGLIGAHTSQVTTTQ